MKKGILGGHRPDITPAQVPGIIAAVAALLSAFGVYDLSSQQQVALGGAVVIAVGLVFGDAKIRGDRNRADAQATSAGIIANGVRPPATHAAAPPADDGVRHGLPSDDEEFATGHAPDDLSDEDDVPDLADAPGETSKPESALLPDAPDRTDPGVSPRDGEPL